MIPVSKGDRLCTPNGEETDTSEAEDEEDVITALSGRREVLLQYSVRRAQCWHGALPLHCDLSTKSNNEVIHK